jgi:hypothetical protein
MKSRLWVVAYSENGDDIEKEMASWARSAIQKLKRSRFHYKVVELPDVNRASLNGAMNPGRGVEFLVLWGHGREQDGAFLDRTSSPVVDRFNFRLLAGKKVLGVYCFSAKLCLQAVRRRRHLPQRFIGFRDEFWFIKGKANKASRGFQECAEIAVTTMMRGASAKSVAEAFRDEASRWTTIWLVSLLLLRREKLNAFLSILALANNTSVVWDLDQSLGEEN